MNISTVVVIASIVIASILVLVAFAVALHQRHQQLLTIHPRPPTRHLPIDRQ